MKHIFLFLSILFTVQIGTAQDQWNACNSTVTVIPTPAYDSTFVLSAPSRSALAKGMASWTPSTSGGGGASYLVYTALLQYAPSGDTLSSVVLENTLGGYLHWTIPGDGTEFTTTLTNAFTVNKTFAFIANSGRGWDGNFNTYVYANSDDDFLTVAFPAGSGFATSIDYQILIEIRVYP